VPDRRSRPAEVTASPAIVHDFFVADGGAERCAIEFANLLPSAQVYTSFFDRQKFGERIGAERVRTWPLQRLLGASPRFRSMLPLYPLYFSLMDLSGRPLVISSSIAFTKAVRTDPSTLHISYVYTPMRYAWDLDTYLAGSSFGRFARLGAQVGRPLLRRWDVATARRPDVIVAISNTVQDRIRRLWGRDSRVIYPPVDVSELPVSTRDDGYLLVAARLLAYRRVDLAVEASRRLGRRLVVAGDGPERARLERIAGPETTFRGHVTRAELLTLFANCSAYLVPGVEDFGIAPVEAMAAGKPVIAYRAGGARETVAEGISGVFFDHQDPVSVVAAIAEVDRTRFDPIAIRNQADHFDRRHFLAAWYDLFEELGVPASLYSRE
jgi:glycosyltransferase involved in cell wall biosynthesis